MIKDVFQAAIAFREALVPSTPRPLEVVRVSISGINEKPSMWEPSRWKSFRKFSQVMTQEMLELRMKQPESGTQQLVNLIVSCFWSRGDSFSPLCYFSWPQLRSESLLTTTMKHEVVYYKSLRFISNEKGISEICRNSGSAVSVASVGHSLNLEPSNDAGTDV